MAMAGGSVIRAAAKVSGIGLVNSSHFRAGVIPETAAKLTVSRLTPEISVKSDSECLSTATVNIDKQQPRKEYDGWVLADTNGEIEQIISPRNDCRSAIFTAPPTVEEAETATIELKDTLEKILVSSPTSNGSLADFFHSSQQLLHVDECDNKVCKFGFTPFPATNAIEAFTLLKRNPEVQGVVASIASDPIVWGAIMQNPALQDYVQSHAAAFSTNVGEAKAEEEMEEEEMEEEEKPLKETKKNCDTLKAELKNIWKNIDDRMVHILNSVSEFLNSLFRDDKQEGGSSGSIFPNDIGAIFGPPMMGVILMVILIAALKRA